MRPVEQTLRAQLEAFKAFKVKHPRLEESALYPGIEVVFMSGLERSSSSQGPRFAGPLAGTTRWETYP